MHEHQEIIQIDTLENCESWLTRNQFFAFLSSCEFQIISNIRIRLPWQLNSYPESALTYPVLVKANSASVTQMSHIMSIVFTDLGLPKALSMYTEPFVIQEFINHDMTVYKIYVIGDQISYKPRESCSNVSSQNSDLVTFNSAEPWSEEIKTGTRIVKELNMELLKEASKIIGKSIGLSIFGYDILVQSETGDYVIVDVNVFPGFKEYAEIGEFVEALIEKKILEKS